MARTEVVRKGSTGVTEDGLEVYRRLREGITAGRFQPNERLVEANLSRMLGAGRTAVRAALVRLDQEGLVTREKVQVMLYRHEEKAKVKAVKSPRPAKGANS